MAEKRSGRQLRVAALAGRSLDAGVPPHHLRLGEGGPRALRFTLKVISSEITGSESFVHLGFGDTRWVMLAHGVRIYPTGTTLTAYVDPERVMTFDQDGLAVTLREAA